MQYDIALQPYGKQPKIDRDDDTSEERDLEITKAKEIPKKTDNIIEDKSLEEEAKFGHKCYITKPTRNTAKSMDSRNGQQNKKSSTESCHFNIISRTRTKIIPNL